MRTLYTGASRLACFLEVLAFARRNPQMLAELDDIVADDEDDAQFPTLALGRVPRSWCTPRLTIRGAVTGWFAMPGRPETLATLRRGFRAAAIGHGLGDLDATAIRDGSHRPLTQAISLPFSPHATRREALQCVLKALCSPATEGTAPDLVDLT